MMNKKTEEPKTGALTIPTDTNSAEFSEFQAILLNKSRERSSEQIRNIELLALKFKIEDYLQLESDEIVLAGTFLKQYLDNLHIKQTIFAKYIGIQPSNLSKLISGERPINYDLAIVFGKIFNMNPMLWIEIHAKNELIRLKESNKRKYNNYTIMDLVSEEKVKYGK